MGGKTKKPWMTHHCPNVSTTPLRQWGFRQCLPLSWKTLEDKHFWHPIAVIWVVDRSRILWQIAWFLTIFKQSWNCLCACISGPHLDVKHLAIEVNLGVTFASSLNPKKDPHSFFYEGVHNNKQPTFVAKKNNENYILVSKE